MGVKRLDHVAVAVEDLAAASALFEGLGLTRATEFEDPGWIKAAFFKIGDGTLVLLENVVPEVNERRRRGDPIARIDHVCFEVDSLEETMRELEARGIEVAAGEFESRDSADKAVSVSESGDMRSVMTKADSTGWIIQFAELKQQSVADVMASEVEAAR